MCPYLLEDEKEMAQYPVVHGISTDAHFYEALDENEEWIGPFADYETARWVWMKRADAPIIASEICYRIERIDIEVPPACTD
jgi:hypothetical protein